MERLGLGALAAAIRTWRRRRLRRLVGHPALIYSNTVTNGELLNDLSGVRGVPVVTHVHELPRFLHWFTDPDALAAVGHRTSQWIAPSEAVRQSLPKVFGSAAAGVHLIRECIDPAAISATVTGHTSCEALDVTEADLVVGASGTLDTRKGADLFAPIARAITRRWASREALAFRWLGADVESRQGRMLQSEIELMDLTTIVRFVGSTARPLPCLARMDIFLLPSREDPYPLAMLEAAALGCPIVCFEGSGGAPEFVNRGAGLSVPYLDIEAMADAAVRLLADTDERERVGARARELAQEHDAATIASQVGSVFDQALEPGRNA